MGTARMTVMQLALGFHALTADSATHAGIVPGGENNRANSRMQFSSRDGTLTLTAVWARK